MSLRIVLEKAPPEFRLTRYNARMGRKVVTVAEFEQLSSHEQDALFEASIATDLSEIPPEILHQAQSLVTESLTSSDPADTP